MQVREAVRVECTWLSGPVIRFVRITQLRADIYFRIKMGGQWYYFVNRGRGLIEFVRDDSHGYPRRWAGQPSMRFMGAQAIPHTIQLISELQGCMVIGRGFVAQPLGGAPSFSAACVTDIEHAPGCLTGLRPTRSQDRPSFLLTPVAAPPRRLALAV